MTEASRESGELAQQVAQLQQAMARMEARERRRRAGRKRMTVLFGLCLSALVVGHSAIVVASDGACPNGYPFCFAAGEPALASSINQNFDHVRDWLEQKVGPAGTTTVTVGGPANLNGAVVANSSVTANAGLVVNGVDNNGSSAALRVTSPGQTLLLDGNEVDSNTPLYLNANSNQPINVGNDLHVRNSVGGAPGSFAATNSALRVLSITGNAWRLQSITASEARITPSWNSYNGAESNTGTLELGYLVLNNKLHFAMLGGRYGTNLRLEIVRASDSAILFATYMTSSRNSFEHFQVNTSTYRNTVVKIRAIDNESGNGGYSWLALSDFFVE